MNLPIYYDVDITQPLLPVPLQQMLVSKDTLANRIGVRLYQGKTPYSPGGQCAGFVVRRDGYTVPITGSINGNEMYIDLPAAAYDRDGPINIGIKNVQGSAVTTVFLGMGTVVCGETDIAIDPGSTITLSVAALIAEIEEARATIPMDYSALSAAVRALQEQPTDTVLYGTTQSLTDAQKAKARGNIAAAGEDVKNATSEIALINNLLEYGDIAYNRALSSVDGTASPNNDANTTDFIPVTPGEILYGKDAGRFWFFDSQKQPKSGGTGILTNQPELIESSGVRYVEVPAGAAYFRISVLKENFRGTAYVAKQNAYEKYLELYGTSGAVKYGEAQTLTDAQKAQARENIGAVGGQAISEIKDATSENSLISNLLEYGTISYNKALSSSNGNTLTTSDTANTTDFIPVAPGEILYGKDAGRYWFYDSQKEYIPGSSGVFSSQPELIESSGVRSVEVPSGASYFRVSVLKENFRKSAYITKRTAYEAYIEQAGKSDSPAGSNLWYYGTLTGGKAINANSAIQTAPDYTLSDYIPVTGINVLYCRGTARYVFCGSEKNIMTETNSKTNDQPVLYDDVHVVAVPEDAYYLLICALTANTNTLIYSASVIENKLLNQSTLPSNLWEYGNLTEDKGVSQNGGITSATGYTLSDYIPVHGIETLYCQETARYAFYDDEKTYIADSSYTTSSRPILYADVHIVDVPEDAYYLLISGLTANTNKRVYAPTIIEKKLLNQAGSSYMAGKKLGVVGHSFPQGIGLPSMKKAFPYIAGAKLGMSSVQNIAIGGSCIAKQADSYEEIYNSLESFEEVKATLDTSKYYLVNDRPTHAHPYMLYKYENGEWAPEATGAAGHTAIHGARAPIVDISQNLDSDVDVILIGAGYNDYQYSWTPFGTFADRTKYTFYGALHVMLYNFVSKYKGIPIFFTDVVVPEGFGNRGTAANAVGKTYSDYRNAIIEVCRYYRVPWIDMDAESNIPVPSIDESWYSGDNIHLSEAGHERAGQFVAGKMLNYLVL